MSYYFCYNEAEKRVGYPGFIFLGFYDVGYPLYLFVFGILIC